MAGNFFRGTTSEQDPRWGNSEKKLLHKLTKEGTFPAEYEIKVDIARVQLPIIEKWISERLIDVLGFEDDIVTNLVINLLAEENLDARKVHMALVGFLEKKTQEFVKELWLLLADAQSNPTGVPSVFLEKKKSEMRRRQDDRAATTRHTGNDSGERGRWDNTTRAKLNSGEGGRTTAGGESDKPHRDAPDRRHRRSTSRSPDRRRRRRSRSSSSDCGSRDRRRRRNRSRSRSRSRDHRRRHRSRSPGHRDGYRRRHRSCSSGHRDGDRRRHIEGRGRRGDQSSSRSRSPVSRLKSPLASPTPLSP